MIACPSCQTKHMPNKLYCDECGGWLGQGPPPGTRKLRSEPSLAPAVGPPLRVRLRTVDGKHQSEHLLEQQLVIGRITPDGIGHNADVDLEPLGAGGMGVSRRHARLVRSGDTVLVDDLGSLNGTKVRGVTVAANHPAPVSSGDQLTFGSLVLRIEWQTSS